MLRIAVNARADAYGSLNTATTALARSTPAARSASSLVASPKKIDSPSFARLPHGGAVQVEDHIGRDELPQGSAKQLSAHAEAEDHDVIRKDAAHRSSSPACGWLDPLRQPRSDSRREPEQRRREHHRGDARREQQLPLRRRQEADFEARSAEDEREFADLRQIDRLLSLLRVSSSPQRETRPPRPSPSRTTSSTAIGDDDRKLPSSTDGSTSMPSEMKNRPARMSRSGRISAYA